MSTPAVQLDRLRSSNDIRAVLASGRRRAGRSLVVHLRSRDDEDVTRLAVVASRRVGTAVARNRAKRLLREAARSQTWPVGVDVVLVARADAATGTLASVVSDLTRALSELGAVS